MSLLKMTLAATGTEMAVRMDSVFQRYIDNAEISLFVTGIGLLISPVFSEM